MLEMSSLRHFLAAILRMISTSSMEEVQMACRTFDVRYRKLEDLREELEDICLTYDLVSQAEFSVTLQQLKTVGVKMQRLDDSGAMLLRDADTLIRSTAALRAEMLTLKEYIGDALSQQAADQAREEELLVSPFVIAKSSS